MPVAMHRRTGWLVGALALLLAGGLLAEAWPAADDRTAEADLPPAAAASAGPAAAAPAPDAPPIADWLNVALSRPLFAADRRPDAAAAAPGDALPRLSGTIRLGDTALAMFQPRRADGTAPAVVVGEGADLAGWTVTDITNGGVTLMRDGRIATLRLSYADLPVPARRLSSAPARVLHDKRTSPFLQP